ncbi:putative SCAR/WAVE family protein [Helianthus annuus]|uniref:SCAR/WAVE family protein n=2 Tax=Helianthus annuus TaxID=4232 RepID=A0A9K3IRL0_HELAN|nr:putative SCAR/WAVE family protein [Helianthus annuus]
MILVLSWLFFRMILLLSWLFFRMILLLGVAEIIRLPSTSSLPSGDGEMPNGIRPMKIQRPRTPLIDAVAAHDKNKLRKVTERAMPLFPKEEEKDTFLEQIRAKV